MCSTDLDMGAGSCSAPAQAWTYSYDSLGRLVGQTDAKGQPASMGYDGLGRMTSRSEPDMVSTWTYAGAANQGTYPNSIDKPVMVACSGASCGTGGSSGSYGRSYQYDTLGRPGQLTVMVGGSSSPEHAVRSENDDFRFGGPPPYPCFVPRHPRELDIFALSRNKTPAPRVMHHATAREGVRKTAGAVQMSDRRRRFEAQAIPHLDAAYNLARWLARPPLDADDIVQDAMLRAYRAFDTVRGDDVKPWLMSIVRNCFLTAAGRSKDKLNVAIPPDHEIAAADSALIADEPDPEATIIQTERSRSLNKVIASLPEDFREVLVLREMEDMSYREIAEITGVPVGTVMSRLARARALLKEKCHLVVEGPLHAVQ